MLPNNMSFDLEQLTEMDFNVRRVGEPKLDSTLKDAIFVDDSERVAYCTDPMLNDKLRKAGKPVPTFVAAGRSSIPYTIYMASTASTASATATRGLFRTAP